MFRRTKPDIIKEILLCGKDPKYFLKNYARIQHPTRGLVPFRTFSYQDDAIDGFLNHRLNIILKARQLGFTTLVAGFIAWFMIFNKDKNVLIVSTKVDVAKNTIRIIDNIIKYLPRELMLCKQITNNKQSIELNNGSRVKAITTSADAGRSEAVSLLFMDEVAHIDKMDEIWTGIAPVISAGGRSILSSTPNGTSNFFYKTYKQAQNYENNFNCRFGTYVNPSNNHQVYNDRFMWWVHPEHDEIWFAEETKGRSARDIGQEYECVGPNVKILTQDGFKEAKDIQVGDLVKTHRGRFRKVLEAQSRSLRENEKVYSISAPLTRQSNGIFITENHPIWQSTVSRPKGRQSYFREIINGRTNLEFVSIKDRVGKQYVNILDVPLSAEETLSNTIKIIDLSKLDVATKTVTTESTVRYYAAHTDTKRFIDVDFNFGKIVGLYLAEGYYTKATGFPVNFAFHSDETEHHEFIQKFASDHNMTYRQHCRLPVSKCTICTISNAFLREAIKIFIQGNCSKSKYLTDNVWKTNPEFIKGIITGIWLGDGLHKPVYKNILGLANQKLIYQIRNLMSLFSVFPRLGLRPCKSLHYLELNNVHGQSIDEILDKGQSCLEIHSVGTKPGSRTRFYDQKLWGRIQTTEAIEFNNKVYNFEVEEDNTYICENLVVHNCNFQTSGDTYLPINLLEQLQLAVKEPIERSFDDRNLWIWKHPDHLGTYIISSDVSSGFAEDFSTIHVIRIDQRLEQVAEYKGKIPADHLGELLMKISKHYNNATIAPENNSGWSGQAVQRITDAQYPFLYWSPRRKGTYVDIYNTVELDEALPGYRVTASNRIEMLAKVEQYIRNNDIILYSQRLVDEFREFIWRNGKPIAASGAHDDLIMALAGGIWIREESFMTSYRNSHMNEALINCIGKKTTPVSQHPAFNQYSPPNVSANRMDLPNGEFIDLNKMLISMG